MISTRSAGLLIDTVVCLTLAKWETVSGRFGGYLRKRDDLIIYSNNKGLLWFYTPMRSLNLDQLRAFVEVVARGSFTAAAKELNLTQPAVTHQVQELERRFHVTLVERFGKRAYLTQAGEKLIVHARQLLEDDARAQKWTCASLTTAGSAGSASVRARPFSCMRCRQSYGSSRPPIRNSKSPSKQV